MEFADSMVVGESFFLTDSGIIEMVLIVGGGMRGLVDFLT